LSCEHGHDLGVLLAHLAGAVVETAELTDGLVCIRACPRADDVASVVTPGACPSSTAAWRSHLRVRVRTPGRNAVVSPCQGCGGQLQACCPAIPRHRR